MTHDGGDFMYQKHGFTLIELLVVVLIIGILSSVALPQYTKAVEKSRAVQALTMLKSIVQAQKVYYMANGAYAQSFDDLDVEIAWTERDNFLVSGDVADARSNGDWSIQLLSSADGRVYAGRLSGQYKGGGFIFANPGMSVGIDPDVLWCVERVGAGVVFGKERGAFCEKMFAGRFVKQVGGLNLFQMP